MHVQQCTSLVLNVIQAKEKILLYFVMIWGGMFYAICLPSPTAIFQLFLELPVSCKEQ